MKGHALTVGARADTTGLDAASSLIADAAEGDPGESEEQTTLDNYNSRFHDPLQYEFNRWIETEDGQRALQAILMRCMLLKRSGHTHYGIGALWESVRYDYSVRLGPDHGFKMNNNYRSRMARYIMDRNPSLEGFFETRRLR